MKQPVESSSRERWLKELTKNPEETPKPRRGPILPALAAGGTVLALACLFPLIGKLSTGQITRQEMPPARNNQTILRTVAGWNDPISVTINGKQVPVGATGSSLSWVDVSPYVQPGENVLRVEGKTPQPVTVMVSHAETANKFRRLGEFRNESDAGRRPEPPYEYRFIVPGGMVAASTSDATSGAAQ